MRFVLPIFNDNKKLLSIFVKATLINELQGHWNEMTHTYMPVALYIYIYILPSESYLHLHGFIHSCLSGVGRYTISLALFRVFEYS